MQNSLVNKIKKNISLEDQVIIEAEYLLENIELFENKDLVLDKLNKIKKTSVDRKIEKYFGNIKLVIWASESQWERFKEAFNINIY